MVCAVEQSTVGILITGPNGVVEYANPKILEVTGYVKREIIGNNPRIFQSGLTSIEIYQNLWATIKAGEEWCGEIINKHKKRTVILGEYTNFSS